MSANDSHTASRLSRRALLTGAAAGALGLGCGPEPAVAEAPRAREGRYLIKNGVVLSFDSKVGDFDRADVLVEVS